MSDDAIVVTTVDTPRPTLHVPAPIAEAPAPVASQETLEAPEVDSQVDATKSADPKGVQRRIDRAVREKYQAQARANALQERLAQYEKVQVQPSGSEPAKSTADGEPLLKDYSDFDKYVKDSAKWVASQQTKDLLAQQAKQFEETNAKAAQQKSAEGWNKRVAAALKELPDYQEVVANTDAPMSNAMQAAIMESDKGPQLAYYLATHPDEAADINDMTPIGAVRALTRIEDGLKAKPVTATPAPIVPTGSKQTAAVKSLTDKSMSFEEFVKRRRAFIAKR